MKKLIVLVLSVCMIFSALCCVHAEDDREIRVAGNATVTLSADFATLQIGVSVKKDSMQQAQKECVETMNALLLALGEAGIAEKDIITSQYSFYSGVDYSGAEERSYYYVDHMLSVTVRDLDRIGTVLDAATQAGANQTYGISFGSTKENEAYQQALAKAVSDAAEKAEVLAQAAGKKLGSLLIMDASRNDYNYGVSNSMNAKGDMGAGTTIVAGDVSVSASVVLIYDFR